MDADKKGKHQLNRRTGQVFLPEAGEGAYLKFSIKAMELLETAYGEDWVQHVIKGMSKMNMPVYSNVINSTLLEAEIKDIEAWDLTWEDLNIRILDALNLAIYGKTYEEQQKINEEQMMKRLQGLEENPQTAAILSLMSATAQQQNPD